LKQFIIKIALSVLAFTTILPMIPGIDFHGNVASAVVLSLVFGIMLWGIELIVGAVATIWTVTTLGLALLWLIPLWITGFWVMPALALMLTADLMPTCLSINGFLPAAEAGFVMLLIGLLTNNKGKKKKKD
jgi:uncharacterized membrane protein YvlD (DUF360 family)